MKRFDPIIIGTGHAGPSLAIRFADLGYKTLGADRQVSEPCCPQAGASHPWFTAGS